MSASVVMAESSHAALGADNFVARQPRWALRRRPPEFAAAFDSKTLFYDCFWHDDGQRVLLVGPPWRNLEEAFAAAFFTALPSRTPVEATAFHSISVTVTSIPVPAGTTALSLDIAGEVHELKVQPNFSAALAGSRVLFSMSRDNDLEWIAEWARFHARHHGTDTVVLFDNGSTRYSPAEITETLRAIDGLNHVAVPSWPSTFGPFDPAVVTNPFWAHFLQIASQSVVLRRFGAQAYGLLNCDVDELAGTRSKQSIYDLAHESRGGLVVFTGTWIEATGGRRHRDFTLKLPEPKASTCGQRKWVLDPTRPWVRRLSVHPYWHWIEGRDRSAKSMPADALYWHFKGINTNWKQRRTAPPSAGNLVPDALLSQLFEEMSP